MDNAFTMPSLQCVRMYTVRFSLVRSAQCPHCTREIALQMSYVSSADVFKTEVGPPVNLRYRVEEEPSQNSPDATSASRASETSSRPADGFQEPVHETQLPGVRVVLDRISRDELLAASEDACDEPGNKQHLLAKKAQSKSSVVAFSDKVRCVGDDSWYEENLTYSDSDKDQEMDNEWDTANGDHLTSMICRQCNRVLCSKASRIRHERTQHGILEQPVRTKTSVASFPPKPVNLPPTPGDVPPEHVINGQSTLLSPESSRKSPSVDLQKKYSCDICNKKFNFYHLFTAHNRIHTGEKPFKCDDCDRHFAFKHHLGTHKLTHLNLKPYDCPHCDRKFPTKSSQIRHTRSHLSKSNLAEETEKP